MEQIEKYSAWVNQIEDGIKSIHEAIDDGEIRANVWVRVKTSELHKPNMRCPVETKGIRY
jgi:hypothetical protein